MSRRVLLLLLGGMVGLLLVADRAVGPAAAGPTDATDAVWADFRARHPAIVPVYRPTALPARFRQVPELVDGTYLGVLYRGDDGGSLAFTISSGNSAPSTSEEPTTVHDQPGFLVTTAGSPAIGIFWREAGESYAIRGDQGVGRKEIVRVAASLAPVGPDGVVTMPGLPNTGGGGSAWPPAAPALAFAATLLALGAAAVAARGRRRAV